MRQVGYIGIAIILVALLVQHQATIAQGFIDLYVNDTLIAQRAGINLKDGDGITITGADDGANNRANATIAADITADSTTTFTNKTMDADNNTFSNFRIGDEVLANVTSTMTLADSIALQLGTDADGSLSWDGSKFVFTNATTTWLGGIPTTWTFDTGSGTLTEFQFGTGQFDFVFNSTDLLKLSTGGGVVFNEGAGAIDSRFESQNNAQMLYISGANDLVGIGNLGNSSQTLQVGKTVTNPGTGTRNAVSTSGQTYEQTSGAASGVGAGLFGDARATASNNQNWTNTVGFRGVWGRAVTNGSGTWTGAAALYSADCLPLSTSVITNCYGLYIEEIDTGTNNHALFSAGAGHWVMNANNQSATASNLYLGVTPGSETSTDAIIFGDGAEPISLPSNSAALYADDVSGTTQLFACDETLTCTQISSHPSSFLDTLTSACDLPFAENQSNPYIGKQQYIDWCGLLVWAESVSGQQFIHTSDIPRRDWYSDEAEKVLASIDRRTTAQLRQSRLLQAYDDATDPVEKRAIEDALQAIVIPDVYTIQDPPKWLREADDTLKTQFCNRNDTHTDCVSVVSR